MPERPPISLRTVHTPRRAAPTLVASAIALALSACVPITDTPDATTAAPNVVVVSPVIVIQTPVPTITLTPTPQYFAHIVRAGENLTTIAAFYNVPLDELMKINNIKDPNTIYEGQQLAIPSSASPVVSALALTANATPCQMDSDFISDVTIPDNTVLKAGAIFTKTWRLRNSGTCTWTDGYRLVLIKGTAVGAPPFVTVPQTLPGATVDISINMVAPKDPGTYTSIWQIESPDGKSFGAIPYVRIVIPGAASVGGGPLLPNPADGLALISGITKNSRTIFLKGQQMGNRADVFSKVGDSITFSGAYLADIGDGRTVWGGYGNLAPVAGFFMRHTARTGNSFNNVTYAAFPGWEAIDLTDPGKALQGCDGRAPLDCELNAVKPSIAIIMIGTNDSTGHEDLAWFEGYVNQVVEKCIASGVIPVLSTIPWNAYQDVKPYNGAIIDSARAHDIPLLNTYGAFENLSNHGVGSDGVHPTVPPDGNTADFSGEGLKYGYNLRNLITLQMLDALWRQVLSY